MAFANRWWSILGTTILAGCAGGIPATSTEADDPAAVESALELENGGYDISDEAPLFGDDDLFADMGGEDPVPPAALGGGPEVEAMARMPGVRSFHLFVAFGNQDRDPRVNEWTTWDGGVAVSAGALVVNRTILFEEPRDHLLPRPDRQHVGWVAQTMPHWDGVLMTYLLPPPPPGARPEVTFEVRAGRYAKRFQLGDVPLAIHEDLGPGRQVTILAGERPARCAHGFLLGKWHALKPGLGVFRGKWVSESGRLDGHLKGIWGKTKAGRQVFFGKYIDRDGGFHGLLGGHWGDGRFAGGWIDRDKKARGTLGGHYRPAPEVRDGGFFAGRWEESSCR